MATKDGPIIVEPTGASGSLLPATPSLSPQTYSSSDSFDSSRPISQASSMTSRSASPSPVLKSSPTIEDEESIELPDLPSNPSSPKKSIPQTQRENDTPRSIPPGSTADPSTPHATSWPHRFWSLIPRRNRFANILGTISLGLTLIGMIIFGLRAYKLSVWTAWNDILGTCGQLSSSGVRLGPNCQKLLSDNTADVELPPYSHWKRTMHATLRAGSEILHSGFTRLSTLETGRPENDIGHSIFKFSSTAIVLCSTVIIGGVSLILFRRYWRTEEVFTSPVKSACQVIRHYEEGPETVTGEGYHIIRRNPQDDHPLGQLRQRIRNSQPNAVENPTGEPTHSYNTSEDTLVGPWKDTTWGTSKVSLTNDTSKETHDNLIELDTEGPSKTFFDPETGEFIHLTPWKSTGDEDSHGLQPDGKGSIRRAFAQMTIGATGWAAGKSIDDQLAEKLQRNSKGGKKEPMPHQPGDCVTGNMTNQDPSAKPTIA